jgi:hypothetical protein
MDLESGAMFYELPVHLPTPRQYSSFPPQHLP